MNRILVFGGSGFIGESIVHHLNDRADASVKVINRSDLDFFDLSASVCFHLNTFNPDIILYAAGFNRRFAFQEVELLNEHKILAILSHYAGKLIYLSSSLVYDSTGDHLTVDESTRVAPTGEYGFFKAICEDIISTHHNWTILRLSSIVGKNKKESVFQFIFNHVVRRSSTIDFKFSDSQRDYLHINLCGQIIADLTLSSNIPSNNYVNISSAKVLSLSEIACKMYQLSNIEFIPTLTFGDPRPDDPSFFLLANRKMLQYISSQTRQKVFSHCPIADFIDEL